MVEAPLAEGVVGRATGAGCIDVRVHDLRDFTTDRHRVVDDVPFGGGPGMVLKPEPLFAAVERIRDQRAADGRSAGAVILTSPRRRAVDARGGGAAESGSIVSLLLCGRYEGVDERVRAHLATDEHVDRRLRAVGRRTAGAGDRRRGGAAACRAWWATRHRSPATRSRGGCWTTRTTRGRRSSAATRVPDVLLSGHHAEIERWRRREALRRTAAAAAGSAGRGARWIAEDAGCWMRCWKRALPDRAKEKGARVMTAD